MSPTKQTEAKNNVSRIKKRGLCQQDRPVIEPNAAGIDVGAREMYVAIPPDRDPDPVRVFKTFTADLEALIDWLVERGITTVAMEATGVYWIPVYQMLEDRGVRACLVNASRFVYPRQPGAGGIARSGSPSSKASRLVLRRNPDSGAQSGLRVPDPAIC